MKEGKLVIPVIQWKDNNLKIFLAMDFPRSVALQIDIAQVKDNENFSKLILMFVCLES